MTRISSRFVASHLYELLLYLLRLETVANTWFRIINYFPLCKVHQRNQGRSGRGEGLSPNRARLDMSSCIMTFQHYIVIFGKKIFSMFFKSKGQRLLPRDIVPAQICHLFFYLSIGFVMLLQL